jgi:hypothetical protein
MTQAPQAIQSQAANAAREAGARRNAARGETSGDGFGALLADVGGSETEAGATETASATGEPAAPQTAGAKSPPPAERARRDALLADVDRALTEGAKPDAAATQTEAQAAAPEKPAEPKPKDDAPAAAVDPATLAGAAFVFPLLRAPGDATQTPPRATNAPAAASVAATLGAATLNGTTLNGTPGDRLLQTLSLARIGGLPKTAGGASDGETAAGDAPTIDAGDAATLAEAAQGRVAPLPAGAAGEAPLFSDDRRAPIFDLKDAFTPADSASAATDDPLAPPAAAAGVEAGAAAAPPQGALDGATAVLSVASFETHFPAAIAQLLPATASEAADAAQSAATTAEQLAALAAKPQQQAIKTISFQLSPEAYGAIDVRMRIVNSRVELQLDASTPQGQALLRESREKLAEAVGASGYAVDVLRIGVSAAPASSAMQNAPAGGGSSQSFAAGANQSEGGNFAGRERASGGRGDDAYARAARDGAGAEAPGGGGGGRASGLYL